MPITGQMTLNGVTDKGLIAIIEIKDKTPGIIFSLNQIQTVPIQGQQPKTASNNVIVSWTQASALSGIQEILTRLAQES